jgi:hypothetical protein
MRLLCSSSLFGGVLLLIAGCGGSSSPTPPPALNPPTWEYTVLINESGEHFPPHLRELADEGWEVYLVTGGQPYVSSTRTANGETTNTVTFTRRDYYLKRQK